MGNTKSRVFELGLRLQEHVQFDSRAVIFLLGTSVNFEAFRFKETKKTSLDTQRKETTIFEKLTR